MHKEQIDKELDPMDEHPRTIFFNKEEPLQKMENINPKLATEVNSSEQTQIPITNNLKKSVDDIIDKAIEKTVKKPTNTVPKILEKYIDPQKAEEAIMVLAKEIQEEKKLQEEIKENINSKSQLLKKARTTLQENQKKLETILQSEFKVYENQRLEMIGKMSSKMAHDIRNPLSVLKMQVELMKIKQTKQEDEIMSSSISRMEKAICDITSQINDVLTFIRQPKLELISCDLKDIVKNSIEELQIPDAITLTQSVDSCVIQCDMTKIKGIITNILHNAIQAIKGKGEVSIIVEDHENSVDIKIIDTGSGIPEEIMDKIFEPMFTTKPLGTGLGLASCKQFLEMHGGAINVKNNPTTFTITLSKTNVNTS